MSRRTFSSSLPWTSTCRSSTISPSVSVPVLSLQRIVTLPKSSMAASCLTRTFFFVIRLAPWANVTVMIIGIISGVIPTASATENRNDSSNGRWSRMFTSRTNSTSAMITRVIISPKWRMPRPNSVSGGRAANRWAISPNAVYLPVETITAVPIPVCTAVPRKTLLPASATPRFPSVRSRATFSTGRDSPVRADSRTCRSFTSSNRASAGTRSPALSRITSPRTSSATGSSRSCPSRRTAAVVATCLRISSTACRAWNSMKKFSSTLSRTIAMMINPPTGSPSTREMVLATRRMMTRGLAKKRKKPIRVANRDSCTRLFGPSRRSRSAASAEVSPAGVACNWPSSSPSGLSQKLCKCVCSSAMRMPPGEPRLSRSTSSRESPACRRRAARCNVCVRPACPAETV